MKHRIMVEKADGQNEQKENANEYFKTGYMEHRYVERNDHFIQNVVEGKYGFIYSEKKEIGPDVPIC